MREFSTLVINTGMAALILSITAIALVLALVWEMKRQTGVFLHALSTPQPRETPSAAVDEAKWRSVDTQLGLLEEKMERLTKAVADGIDHVDRNEKRVRGIVVGATRRFENSEHYDAAVDAELDTLPEIAEDFDQTPEHLREPVSVTEPSVDGAASLVPGDY